MVETHNSIEQIPKKGDATQKREKGPENVDAFNREEINALLEGIGSFHKKVGRLLKEFYATPADLSDALQKKLKGYERKVSQANIFQEGAKLKAVALALGVTLSPQAQSFDHGASATENVQTTYEQTIDQKELLANKLERERKDDFKSLVAYLEKNKTEEKIKELRSYYGMHLDELLFANGIDNTLACVRNIKNSVGKDNLFVYKDDPYGIMTLGSIVSRDYRTQWQEPPKEKREARSNQHYDITGFEHSAHFTNDDIRTYLIKKYHPAWIAPSTEGIDFVAREKQTPEQRGALGQSESFSILSDPQERFRISIYENDFLHENPDELLHTLDHEIAHQNEWSKNVFLTSGDRINFLYETTQRLYSADRYKTPYVENDVRNRKYLSDETKNYTLVSEYWAVVAQAYNNNPATFKKNHPKDAALYEKWYKKTTMEAPKNSSASTQNE